MNSTDSGKATIELDRISLSQLSDYIVSTHHDFVRKEMPQILTWLQRVVMKHGERHPEMVKVAALFEAVNEEMTAHMQKEEHILFPRIKDFEERLLSGQKNHLNVTYLKSPIGVMEQEHDHAGELLGEIRKLTNDYNPPKDACTTFRLVISALKAFEVDLHQHVHLENNILFPKSLNLFINSANLHLN
jgi:regulator of cell morphogenesis and NO signaling